MSTHNYDVVIVGSGAGGSIAAKDSAERGHGHRFSKGANCR